MRAIEVKDYLKVSTRRSRIHRHRNYCLLTHPKKGPQDLTVSSLPNPIPSADQYLIAIHATATNFFDLLQIRGKYQYQ